MAFGITREELNQWKRQVRMGEVAFLTHYWVDDRFPGQKTVTKVGCTDVEKLIRWGNKYDLDPNWIDYKPGFPHFDLFGDKAYYILKVEGKVEQWNKFHLS
ncbi:hypothetical protein [Mangrovibacillus cuniculi]|uniref:YneQ n=1 Tax=Mangrovibacillus cuniculi TaxID=2593652 RepID=A0A7S8CAY5_9BACI|nr:hypothetical protein [Mangrovibacillus cuniculi]QPC46468.1 hypothetical protein G8O30_05560 [Mangrovibacillus cuniculi]